MVTIVALALLAWFWWRAGTGAVPPQSNASPGSRAVGRPVPARISPKPLTSPGSTDGPQSRTVRAASATNPAVVRARVIAPSAVIAPVREEHPLPPGPFPRPVQDAFEAQIALDRLGISCGSIDGQAGSQTRAALRAFQARGGLPGTGLLDPETRNRLVLADAPCAIYEITAQDLARLQPVSATWLGKSQQSRLDYESALELVAEKGHAHPNLIRRLNPGIDWYRISPGAKVLIPDFHFPEVTTKAAFLTIALAEKKLEAFDANSRLMVHFPCSIALRVEKRPVGQLHVAVLAPNPNYTFDPDVFPESAEGRKLGTRLVLPPGPNNPVGVVWIGLDKPGYGIHGTPNPELVGRTESHGCFRLANWNVERLLDLVWVGMPVNVVP